MDTTLHDAATSGDLEKYVEHSKKFSDINPSNKDTETPLHLAAFYGHFSICEFIVQRVKDVNPREQDGSTPLYWAALNGHTEVVRLLLEKTNDPNLKRKDGRTPLHSAASNGHKATCQAIIDKVTDVDPKDEGGRTPLYFACLFQHVEIALILIERSNDPNPKESRGNTLLHRAVRNMGNFAICKAIVDKIDNVDLKDINGTTPLHWAAQKGHTDIFMLLFERTKDPNPDSNQGTPLHDAATFGHLSICQAIVDRVKDVDPEDSDGRTPLILALTGEHTEVALLLIEKSKNINPWLAQGILSHAVYKGNIEIFKAMLPRVKDFDIKEEDGSTPLYWAALKGHLEIFKLLFEKAKEHNPKRKDGETPLHAAARNGHKEICQMIIDKIDDANPQDDEGDTPLHYVVADGDFDTCQLILNKTKLKNPMNYRGITPFHHAAREGYLDLFKTLMANSEEININPTDRYGQNPEKYAKWNNDIPLTELIHQMKTENGLSWSRISNQCELQKIMFKNDIQQLRKFLKDQGNAKILDECSHVNDLGYNPLMTAAEFKSRDTLHILLKHLSQMGIHQKRKKVQLHQIFHQSNLLESNKKSLLAVVVHSDYFGEEIISKVVECEGHVHNWNSEAFKRCLYDNLETNENTRKCINIFKEKNIEGRGFSKFKKAIIYCTILFSSAARMSSVSFDVGSDFALLYQYGTDSLLESYPKNCKCTESNCSTSQENMNNTMNDYKGTVWDVFLLSSINCFLYTLVPIIIPCCLNGIEAISFVVKKERELSIPIKIIIVVFSPLWLIIVFIYGSSEGLKKKLRQKSDDESEKLINEAKMIEVVTEASLQPILQLYLFLLSLLCSTDLYNTCINLWTIVQILSFLSSVLSVPRNFTQTYAHNQNGMMTLESKAAYFIFSLSGVISRILSFQLLAFVSQKFWLIYAFVGAHVAVILIINLTFTKLRKCKAKEAVHSQWWLQAIVSSKDHIKDAMANIYVPWSNGKNERLDAGRHILIEVIIFVETLAISLWAVTSGFGHEDLDKQKTTCIGIIWGCYSFYICLKILFFIFLHQWSELIKNPIKRKICCENTIDEDEMNDDDGGEITVHA